MQWWKRLIFSIISLVWGFVTLDYLYLVFCCLANRQENIAIQWLKRPVLMQFTGFVLFLIWGLIMVVYFQVIRNSSPKVDLVVTDPQTGKEAVKRKWFDFVLQGGFLITGAILRLIYLLLIYFPNQ